jgi:hypothetical protein
MDFLKPLIAYYTQGLVADVQKFSYSENRGQSIARLSGWSKFCEQNGLKPSGVSQLIACVGEITNNSFDHNIGHWHDIPGCCVSWSTDKGFIRFGIADRGRSIIESLKPVLPIDTDNKSILQIAFEKVISGRRPEQRGNGLKFVRAQVLSSPNHSLICISAGQLYSIGDSQSLNLPKLNFGTLTIINWSLI